MIGFALATACLPNQPCLLLFKLGLLQISSKMFALFRLPHNNILNRHFDWVLHAELQIWLCKSISGPVFCTVKYFGFGSLTNALMKHSEQQSSRTFQEVHSVVVAKCTKVWQECNAHMDLT